MARRIETQIETEIPVVIDLGTASVETLGNLGAGNDEQQSQRIIGLADE